MPLQDKWLTVLAFYIHEPVLLSLTIMNVAVSNTLSAVERRCITTAFSIGQRSPDKLKSESLQWIKWLEVASERGGNTFCCLPDILVFRVYHLITEVINDHLVRQHEKSSIKREAQFVVKIINILTQTYRISWTARNQTIFSSWTARSLHEKSRKKKYNILLWYFFGAQVTLLLDCFD